MSSRERDALLMKEAKEDGKFRSELCEIMKESNKVFANTMNTMSSSMAKIAECMSRSFEQMVQQNCQPSYQQQIPVLPPNLTTMHPPNFIHIMRTIQVCLEG